MFKKYLKKLVGATLKLHVDDRGAGKIDITIEDVVIDE